MQRRFVFISDTSAIQIVHSCAVSTMEMRFIYLWLWLIFNFFFQLLNTAAGKFPFFFFCIKKLKVSAQIENNVKLFLFAAYRTIYTAFDVTAASRTNWAVKKLWVACEQWYKHFFVNRSWHLDNIFFQQTIFIRYFMNWNKSALLLDS